MKSLWQKITHRESIWPWIIPLVGILFIGLALSEWPDVENISVGATSSTREREIISPKFNVVEANPNQFGAPTQAMAYETLPSPAPIERKTLHATFRQYNDGCVGHGDGSALPPTLDTSTAANFHINREIVQAEGVYGYDDCNELGPELEKRKPLTGSLKGAKNVPLNNGISNINAPPFGKAIVVKGFRDNGTSPHSSSIYTFYIPEGQDENRINHIVNIHKIDSDTPQNPLFQTWEGADGVLSDIKLLTTQDKTYLVISDRLFGQSFADSQLVLFDVYALQENTTGDWETRYFFEYIGTQVSKRGYRDVNEAFLEEFASNLN